MKCTKTLTHADKTISFKKGVEYEIVTEFPNGDKRIRNEQGLVHYISVDGWGSYFKSQSAL